MDLESFLHLPIVYTTRLDEMAILRKDITKIRSQDIIKSIITESKPQYRTVNHTHSQRIHNINHKDYELAESYQQYSDVLSKQTDVKQSTPISRLTFENLMFKIEEIKNKSNSSTSITDVVIKTENDTNIIAENLNKLKSLLALCKPLKIVLEDIRYKQLIKTTEDINMEVVSISSDSDDDDVIAIGHDKLEDRTKTNNEKYIAPPAISYTVKTVNDLKDILIKEDLKNSVIVIYNFYLQELDAYQIGENYNVTEYKTIKYTELHRFPMKKCQLIVNIIACCWKNRQSYVLLLLNYKQYYDIAKFIDKTHPCQKQCTCCCFYLEQFCNPLDDVNKASYVTVQDSSLNNRQSTFECSSKIIAIALKFKKNSKWKGYPSDLNLKKKSYHSCNRLLEMNNAKDGVEYYEFGCDNLIYSKVVTNGADSTPWLFDTFSQFHSDVIFKYATPAIREKKIVVYRQIMNIISFETECFLRLPITIKKQVLKKSYPSNKNQDKTYKIEHTRSFMGASGKKSKFSSITSEIHKSTYPSHSVDLLLSPTKQITEVPRGFPHQTQLAIMEQEVSQTINRLIKDILHRFRNVLLTINDEGKVSAALNAPLSSLTHSELNILSQILSHAQSQVDKLGLKPGMCLNPEAPSIINAAALETSVFSIKVPNTAADETSTTTVNDAALENSGGHNIQAFEYHMTKNSVYDSTTFLSHFSTIITKRKQEYNKSFRNYLSDILKPIPKITSVFSLSNANISSNTGTTLDRKNASVGIDNTEIVSTEMINRPQVLESISKNDMSILDNKIKSKQASRRKRKTNLIGKTKPPKIRVKTPGEILVEDPLNIPGVSQNDVDFVGIPSVPVIPIIKLESDDVIDDNCVRNGHFVEPNDNECLPALQPVSHGDTPSTEVHNDVIII